MDAISKKYKDAGVNSIFLYTHEAHPGEHYPHHTSLEQKLNHARDFRETFDVSREVYVDSLSGDCHRAYGSMPNMTWIFTRSGIPIYKSDWTDSSSVENALIHFLDGARRRRQGTPVVPFNVKRLDFRKQDRDAFYQGLKRNGPKAVREFREAFG